MTRAGGQAGIRRERSLGRAGLVEAARTRVFGKDSGRLAGHVRVGRTRSHMTRVGRTQAGLVQYLGGQDSCRTEAGTSRIGIGLIGLRQDSVGQDSDVDSDGQDSDTQASGGQDPGKVGA
jgi:hypothetical protein